jgi:Ca2+-binding RTX toxin-like protein
MRAGPGDDRLFGISGKDVMDGGAGADTLIGGTGGDRITGGPGADRIVGGKDDDTIAARDGVRDRIDCGTGKRDTVRADRRDRIVGGCERVRR